MTGAGNDFVVIDNREGLVPDGSATAKRLCNRHWGIGADGLLLLEKSRRGAYRMMYYNADGSYGGMCGNGGRCMALFAVQHGIAPTDHNFESLDYEYHAVVRDGSVTLSMKEPRDLKINLVLPIGGKKIPAMYVDTGSPHVVIIARRVARKGLSEVDVVEIGRKVRNMKRFAPNGANVNFIEMNGHNSLKVRTYERGVEDETLACGTGSIAAAVAGCEAGMVKPPVKIIPRSGKMLVVDFRKDGSGWSGTTLSGPAESLFQGEFVI